jgi:hypothetical protein
MTVSHVGSLRVSFPIEDSVYVGTKTGLTRVNSITNTKQDFQIEGSIVPGVLGIIQGLSNNVVGLHIDNVVSLVTSGTLDALTYLSMNNSLVYGISGNTDLRTLGAGENKLGYVENSYGAIGHSSGELSIFKKDLGVKVWTLRIVNDEEVVDFGDFGLQTEASLSEAEVGVTGKEEEIKIYNDSTKAANANVLITFTGNETDNFIEISDSLFGPYFGFLENSVSFPDSFPWENGYFQNTQVIDNKVTISGTAGPFVYTSPVIDTGITDLSQGYRVFWGSEEPGISSIDYGDEINGQKSIKFRQSSVPPGFGWVDGELPVSSDPRWGLPSGTLDFDVVPNYSIDFVFNKYVQFQVNLNPHINDSLLVGTESEGFYRFTTESGSLGDIPALEGLGIERPVIVSNIPPGETKSIFARSNIPEPASGTRRINTQRTTSIDVWWDVVI